MWHNDPIPADLIACCICNKATKMITVAHLKSHDLTVAEYKARFPNAPMACPAVNEARSKASSGKVLSRDTRDKIAKKAMGHKRNLGRSLSEEHKKTISISKTGVSRGEEFSRAMSEARKGKYPEHLRGIMSEDIAQKISQVRLRHVSAEALVMLNDPEILRKMVDTIPLSSIAAKLNVSIGSVVNRCKKYGIEYHKTSSLENAIANYIKQLGVDAKFRCRTTIAPRELDIFVPDRKFAIEICGVYWHSDVWLANNYHLEKLKMCEEKGIRLLTIFEDEILEKIDVVKSRIAYMIGQGKTGVGGRKLSILPIDFQDAYTFLNRYHIQGGSKQIKINYGAFFGNELIAVMSFKKSWRHGHLDDVPYELTRFATDGKNYPGVASRLFKMFVTEHTPNRVITYADRRWSNGDLYIAMGFSLDKTSPPSYHYTKGQKRYDKSNFRLKNIRDRVPDGQQKTEREIMSELGYHRIYDCGHLRFEWIRPT